MISLCLNRTRLHSASRWISLEASALVKIMHSVSKGERSFFLCRRRLEGLVFYTLQLAIGVIVAIFDE